MYRIKEIKNRITNESKFKLQIKVLWWWNDCHREIGWGCSEPIICSTLSECEDYKREREIESAW
ncbi:hypothetical protein [Tenacibaculum phage JQ]|nr:hypothetical protein [Tenacibaculum phage JQ]